MLAEPVGKLGLGEFTGGEGLDGGNCLPRLKRNFYAVQHKECAGKNPCGAFVAIGEGVIARDAEGVRRGERAQIILAIFPLIAGAAERGFKGAFIAQARWPTMFGQLAIMDGQRETRIKPDGFKPHKPIPNPFRMR